MILKDDVTAAIRRAFQLGQTYWQQADSESYKENKKADATRDRYNALCIETAEIAARADTRIAELETAMKRQAAAVRMLDMSHVARAETMMQHAQVLHDLSKPDELESLRQANAILTADVERAEAELARLRAQEPVAWMWNDEIGVPHASAGSKKPVWLESSASAEYIKQANLRPLYAAPPAPIAEIREVVVTRPMCHGAWARFWSEPNNGDSCDQARRWLEAWRSELGPALGLVEIREPTPEECDRILDFWVCGSGEKVSAGRAMFAAVSKWLKGEL